MNSNKNETTVEYYLGESIYDDEWGYYTDGYEIVKRDIHEPPGKGIRIFTVENDEIAIDDKKEEYYGGFISVGELVVEHVRQIFCDAASEMMCVSGEPIPADWEFHVGDCVERKGHFLRIVSLSDDRCNADELYADDDVVSHVDDVDYKHFDDNGKPLQLRHSLAELREGGRLITAEQFSRLRDVARNAISEAQAYLKGQYEHHSRLQEVLERMDKSHWGEEEYYLMTMHGKAEEGQPTEDGFYMVRHYANHPLSMGSVCFEVSTTKMRIPRSFPATCGDEYVKVGKEVYQRVMQMLQDAIGKLGDIGGEEEMLDDRSLEVGECFRYVNEFFRIVKVLPDSYHTKTVGWSDGITAGPPHITICDDGKPDDCHYTDLSKEMDGVELLITAEKYNEAKVIMEDGIREVKEYLGKEYERGKSNQ